MEIRTTELGELQALMKEELKGLYPERELGSIIKGIFSHLTGLSAAQLVMEKERKLNEAEIFYLQRALRRLKDQEPLQYVTGVAHFHGMEFKVDKRVLIPRPETEELVQWVFEEMSGQEGFRALDVGTGSGCIAVSLKKNLPSAEVYAIDVSAEALALAGENADSLGVDIKFKQLDIMKEEGRGQLPAFDIIVSNPPYVTLEDKERMLPNVIDYEPALALFVEDDPLAFYRAIVDFSQTNLNPGGSLFFECNENYTDLVLELMRHKGYHNLQAREDLQGKKRMVFGTRL